MPPAATQSPAAAPAAAAPTAKPSPKQRRIDSKTMVSVYNRSPATFTHELTEVTVDPETQAEIVTVTGKVILVPGHKAEVPENIADIWKRISNGLVIPADEADKAAKANASALAAANQKVADLEAKVAAFEARMAELEASSAPKKGNGKKPETNPPADAPAGGQ